MDYVRYAITMQRLPLLRRWEEGLAEGAELLGVSSDDGPDGGG
ncbi:MAG: hypothetical protein ACR2G7_04435 [Acidimicrobiales bacterium]